MSDEQDLGFEEFESTHTHSNPWPSEWLAAQRVFPHIQRLREQIFYFIEQRGMEGFTPNMFCEIAYRGDESRIMSVRRRFVELWKDEKKIRRHPDGVAILNRNGNPVTAWIAGEDPNPNAFKTKLQLAYETIAALEEENRRLKERIQGQLFL